MKKSVIICLLLCKWVNAQIYPFEKNYRWGFTNQKGDTISLPLFNETKKFCDSLYFVRNGRGWHVIHENGYIDYQNWYSSVEASAGGKAVVGTANLHTFMIINTQLRSIFPLSFSKHYTYPQKNHLLLCPETKNDSSFIKGKPFYVFDKKLDLKFTLDAFSLTEYNSKTGAVFLAKFKQGFQLLNTNGYPMFAEYYDEIEYKEGMNWFIGSGNGLKGVYSLDGTCIIPQKYQHISESSDSAFSANAKLFAVKTGENKSIILNEFNQVVLSVPFETEDFFNEGIIVSYDTVLMRKNKLFTETKFGIVDWNGGVKLKPVYESICCIKNGIPVLLATEKENTQRLINFGGKEVCHLAITDAEPAPFAGFLLLHDKKENCRLFNYVSGELKPVVFDGFSGEDGYQRADDAFYQFYGLSGNEGIMNKNGDVLIPPDYEYFDFQSLYTISASRTVSKNGDEKSFYYDFRKSTEPVFIYDELIETLKDKIIVMKKNNAKKEEYFSIDSNSVIAPVNYP